MKKKWIVIIVIVLVLILLAVIIREQLLERVRELIIYIGPGGLIDPPMN